MPFASLCVDATTITDVQLPAPRSLFGVRDPDGDGVELRTYA